VTRRRKNASTNTHIFKTRMAKYYPDIAKGAKGTRFQTRFIVLFCTVFCSLFCANKSAISRPPPERISRRGVSPFFLSSFSSKKKQIYSPALCPTKTNSPWTRNQSPAGYVFYPRLSFLSDLESDSRLSLRSNHHHRTRDRNIERFLLRCLSVEKSPDEEKRTKRTFSHARTLSLSFNL
jgi:hypothetical protein